MDIYNLKGDPDYPHHYFIGVSMHTIMSKTPGKLYLKYGPIYFNHQDLIDIQNAAILINDKLFKTTPKDAMEIHNCTELVNTISMFKISCNVNQCTIHHFSSKEKFDDDYFEILVDSCNVGKLSDLLKKSRI